MDWKDIQSILRNEGFNPGVIDGIPGRMTIGAVKRFQKASFLEPDGIVGPKTLAALRAKSPSTPAGQTVPPWYAIALQKKGLHEGRNHGILSRFLRSDGRTLGDPAKLPWCFPGYVEVLTSDGWQRFDGLTADQIWQVDDEGCMSLGPYIPVKKQYDGDAFSIDSAAVSLICDEGHRWWGSWGYHGRSREPEPNRFGTLDSLTYHGLTLQMASAGPSEADYSDEDLRFIAAYLSDGFIHRGNVRFSVSKQRKIDALLSLQPRSVYAAKKVYGEITVEPLTEFSFEIPDWFDDVITPEKNVKRAFINSLSARQSQVFLSGYAVFDGHTRDDGRITLYTSNEAMRDDLVQAAVMAGYWPGVSKGGKSDLTVKESWRVDFAPKQNLKRRILAGNVKKTRYRGDMYCVTVPMGRIIVRGQNMVPCVTGNCGDFVETCIALALPQETLPRNPYLARNWLTFGKKSGPALGAVAVFWRGSRNGTSGHVGFYAGEDATHIHVLGGNQSNRVSIARISKDRLLGYRIPMSSALINTGSVTRAAVGEVTTNEA